MKILTRIRYLLTGCILAALAACAQAPAPELRVGTNVWPGYEPLYLARSLGWLPDGVRLVEYPSSTETMRGLRNGTIEAGALTLDEALSLQSEGVDLTIVLVMDVSDGADVVLARPEMPNGLAGARIGVETTALGAFMLSRFLESQGLAPEDVHIVPLTLDQHEDAFVRRQIDAVVTFEPVKSRLLRRGARLLFDSSRIPGEIVDVLAVRREVLPTQRRHLHALIARWFDALDYLQRQPADAAQRMSARLKLEPDQVLAQYEDLSLPDRAENLALLQGTNARLKATAERLQKLMLEKKLILRPARLEGFFSDACLKVVGD